MKEVVVLSGKGGTGKTSIVVVRLAGARQGVIRLRCGCGGPDLLLSPTPLEEHEFWSGQVAVIDPEKCTRCGLCEDACRFDAIHDCQVAHVGCEGCGLCARICPAGAIRMKQNLAGHWFISSTRFGPLVHAKLASPRRTPEAVHLCARSQGAPTREGLDGDQRRAAGCRLCGDSSLSGAGLACIVTEPSVSGIHDMERCSRSATFQRPAMVCINKHDINEEGSRSWRHTAPRRISPLVAKIPGSTVG
jgi:MinD superfamily P-loop ATPase